MAIAFARARYLSRASGGNAVRSAAYNARESITAERTGELFYFRNRDAPEHHEVRLPEGADVRLADCAVLWNAAEAAEKRKDAQVAREIVLALPADRVLSTEDRIELAHSFAEQHFVAKGLAVQLDVHGPHKDRGEGECYSEDTGGDYTNWHAHLLITTRRIRGDAFSAKKARDLDPEVRRAGGRAVVSEGEVWGELWRAHQDRYFQEHGLDLRVDPTAAHPGEHIGPVRMRKVDSPAVARAEALRTANEHAARDPKQVLAALTRHNATFSERDLDRYLAKHLRRDATADPDVAREIAAVKAAVLQHPSVRALHDRETGEAVGRFTTTAVREQERAALADAAAVAGARHHPGVDVFLQLAATSGRKLRNDQHKAFEHAVSAGGLKLIEGRAGTGKSYTLAAVRDAHEIARYRVVGLAPTNSVAQSIKADGFREAGTVHAALFAIKNGRGPGGGRHPGWDKRTVLVVDEAAMLDSRVTGELLAEARASGAKVILAGDGRQLTSIERGGLFTELCRAHRAAEITEVTRQTASWQRQAARDLAEGRFDAAVASFDRHGAITWSADQEASRAALVAKWTADSAADPRASRFVFAYTNADVDRLNAELRRVRRERGELASPDVRLETKHGAARFAVGDRVQFTDTDKRLHIYNGNAGTIIGLNAATGEITARLDAPSGKEGRVVTWSAAEFQGFRHGYAGTIYKGQGKTLDHTYLLHTHHWRAAASYVALTRQRHSAQVFVARETARNVQQLARQMARGEVRAASVAWATSDELPERLRPATAERPAPSAAHRLEHAPAAPATAVPGGAGERTETAWLIPPRVSPDGRDSFGRGLDAGSIQAAVLVDGSVQREREALIDYLRGAYREPISASGRLDELIMREGFTSAAARLAREPEQLGELRGKLGIFAGAARQEREGALRAAGAMPDSLARIGRAVGAAERTYRASVEAQLAADAVGIPRLSARAGAAIGAVTAANDDAARRMAWNAAQGEPDIRAELVAFRAAVEQRFGAETVRAMLRAEGRAGAVHLPGMAYEQRAVDQVALVIAGLRQGERAAARSAFEATQEIAKQKQHQAATSEEQPLRDSEAARRAPERGALET